MQLILQECVKLLTGLVFGISSRGFYQDRVGQYPAEGLSMNCKKCNPGTFVKEGKGVSPLSCKVCPTGTNKNIYAGFRACFCLENYFRRDRFGKCELCSQVGALCKQDYMTIQPGYYWNWSSPDTRLDEYKSFIDNLQTFNDSYQSSSTIFSGPLPKIHKCPKRLRCVNDNGNIEGNCAKGYTGWMCTSCERKYFPIFGFCRQCPPISVFLLEVALIIVSLGTFLVLLIASYSRQDRDSRSLVDSTLALGKIVLGFYQIMGEFWDSVDVTFWPQLFKQIADWLDFLQFNVANILIKPSCFDPKFELTPYKTFILGSVFPYFVIMCTVLAIAAVRLQAKVSKTRNPEHVHDINSRMRRHQSNILTFMVFILFVTYTSTCNVIFDLYGPTCDTFSLDENSVRNISILRSDYSVSCNTFRHHRYQTASYCSSVYVVALPAVLCYLLWKNSRRCHATEETETGKPTKWLRFLHENYKVNFWYWEIVELIRKVSQTFIIVLFGWNSYFSITVTLTLAVIFLTLHISFKPMKDRFEHYLQVSLCYRDDNLLVFAVKQMPYFYQM